MEKYRIFLKRSAEEELACLPEKELRKVIARIQGLSENPRPERCLKLSAQERYRLRQGDYRIVYSIDDRDRIVMVVKIGHRSEIHKGEG
jgi:mRNA interferase RelE/StbE